MEKGVDPGCRYASNLGESDMFSLFYDACTDTLGIVHSSWVREEAGGMLGGLPFSVSYMMALQCHKIALLGGSKTETFPGVHATWAPTLGRI